MKEKAKPGGRLTARQRARNHRFGKVRAKVEHVFRSQKSMPIPMEASKLPPFLRKAEP